MMPATAKTPRNLWALLERPNFQLLLAFLTLALTGLASYLGGWPYFIGAWVLGTLFIGDLLRRQARPRLKRWTITSVFSLLLGLLFWYAGLYLGQPAETETHGWLTPGGQPAPANNACQRFAPSRTQRDFFLVLGTSGILLPYRGSWQKAAALRACGHDLLWVERKGDELAVDADIYDGRILAQLRGGEFRLNPNNMFRRERPDRHTLVVYDQMGRERLRVRYNNARSVTLTGIFEYPGCERKARVTEREILVTGPHLRMSLESICAVGWGGLVAF
jgi:hypothetical protein